MRNLLLSLLSILCVGLHAQDAVRSEKTALVMVHYGTTYDAPRQKTIDRLNDLARQRFPQMDMREAWTSRMIMKRLKAKGVEKATLYETLRQLQREGYSHVVVQSSNVIEGTEQQQIRGVADQLAADFSSIGVGHPLLYSVDDAQRVCNILVKRHPASADSLQHVVFVGHGTAGPATALYSQLDYMLHAAGHRNHHVATIEGYPTYDTLLAQLREAGARRVKLVPLLFIAGGHATNDIDRRWRQQLEQAGFTVDVVLEGLGEIPEIQAIYMEHIESAMK